MNSVELLHARFSGAAFARYRCFSRLRLVRGEVRLDRRGFASRIQKSGCDLEYKADGLGIAAIDFRDIRAFYKFQISLSRGGIQLLPGPGIV